MPAMDLAQFSKSERVPTLHLPAMNLFSANGVALNAEMASAIRWSSAAARSAHKAGYAHRAGSTTHQLAPWVSPSPQPFQAAGRTPQRSSSMSHMFVHASPCASDSTSPTATTHAPTVTHLQQEQQEQHRQKEQQQGQQGPQQLPATYRRLVAKGCGRSFREVATLTPPLPLPTPGPKEVLLRMRYAGINGGCETFRARGEFWFSPNRDLAEGFPLGAEGWCADWQGARAARSLLLRGGTKGLGFWARLWVSDKASGSGGPWARYRLSVWQ